MFDFLRRPVAAGIGAVLLASAVMLSPGPRGFIAGLSIDISFLLRDQAFGQRRPARESQVAAILIDEATYDTPPFRGLSKELWTPQLATVLHAVNEAGPRAIGMDFVLPTSMETFQRGYEREFRLALKEAADAGRMVLAKIQGQGPPVLPTREQILAVGGLGNVRSVNLPQDDDGIIRHAPLNFPRSDGRGTEAAFAYELARRADPRLVTPPGEQILLNFDGGAPFLTFSLADIYACAAAGNAAFFAAHFKDRVVLLATGLDVEDRLMTSRRFINHGETLTGPRCTQPPAERGRNTDFARATLPGVFVHATAIGNLLRHESLARPTGPARAGFVAGTASLAAVPALAAPLTWAVAALFLVLASLLAVTTIAFQHGMALPLVEAFGAALLTFAMLLAFRFAISDRDKRRIRHMFGLYLAPSVIERMIATGTLPALGGERREMTFLFSDIAGFTTMAEAADPAILLPALNQYLDGLYEIVMQHGGLVMDFAGDGVLALFGAPADLPDHAARGVACARAIDAFTERFRHELAPQELRFGHTRIGLHTGPAMVGNFGATRRLKYTAMGDVVNVASRLEGLNKFVASRVCLSEDTRMASLDPNTRPIGRFQLKGKTHDIFIHQLIPPEAAETAYTSRYREAYKLLDQGAPSALEMFQALHRENPTDGSVHFHLERLRAGICSAIVVMEEK